MKKVLEIVMGVACMGLVSCGGGDLEFDASGIFESTEVVVSAEATGKILSLEVEEGDLLSAGQRVGTIDSVQLYLKKLQLEASLRSIGSRKADIAKQVAATQEQIAKTEKERKRFMSLLEQGSQLCRRTARSPSVKQCRSARHLCGRRISESSFGLLE